MPGTPRAARLLLRRAEASWADYAQEQEEELQALQAILMEDITGAHLSRG